jgi:hypothetical protein
MTIVHLVEDTLVKLRRDFSLLKSLEEAESALKKINQKIMVRKDMKNVDSSFFTEII